MLELLKRDIIKENQTTSVNDTIMESVQNMTVRNAFINPDEIDENDPELNKLIEDIPESDDDMELSDEELEELTESFNNWEE